jgi:hypothetical protein
LPGGIVATKSSIGEEVVEEEQFHFTPVVDSLRSGPYFVYGRRIVPTTEHDAG